MDTDTQVLDPAVIEPAATETIDPVVEAPLDPITGTESGSGSSSNTSNGNQVAVNSNFDYSVHNLTVYSYSSNQNQETLYNGMGQTNSESQLEDGFLCGTSEASGSLSLSRRYRFDSRQYFRGLRRRSRVDRITNFNGDAGDTLELSKRIFKGMGDLDFVAVGSKRGRNRAAKTDSDIIYEQFSGRLYFNANSEEKGFGTKGGLFAIFETAPVLGSSDFIIV
jgi:hypothetical protein